MKDAPKTGNASRRASAHNGVNWDAFGANEPDAHASEWAQTDASDVATVVQLCTDLGYGVTFGRTSDGGALSLAILISGEQPRKFYFTSKEQFHTFTTRLAEHLT